MECNSIGIVEVPRTIHRSTGKAEDIISLNEIGRVLKAYPPRAFRVVLLIDQVTNNTPASPVLGHRQRQNISAPVAVLRRAVEQHQIATAFILYMELGIAAVQRHDLLEG